MGTKVDAGKPTNGDLDPQPVPPLAPDTVPKLSDVIRQDAMAARNAALVGESTDPASGKTILFGLFSTFPWHLKRHSSFLALHFGTVGLFGILLLGYTLIALYPLIDCVRASGYQHYYEVDAPRNAQNPFDLQNDVCEKPYEVGNWIQDMSLGNFCSVRSQFSRSYDCGRACEIVLPAGWSNRDPQTNSICDIIKPCPTEFVDPETDEDTDPWPCCQFNDFSRRQRQAQHETGSTEVPSRTGNDIPIAHVWLWCVVATLFSSAWIAVLQYLQYSYAEAGNLGNVNVAQYAVLLSNVGDVECDPDRLKDFGRYYGDVVAAFYVRNFGRYLSKNIQRQYTRDLYKELEYVKQEDAPDTGPAQLQAHRRFQSFPASLFFWVYKRYLCWWKSVDETIKSLGDRDEQLGTEIEELSKQKDCATGNAIIVFNWAQDAANMLYDHNERNGAAKLFMPPFLGRGLNIATDGVFARTPKIALTKGTGAARTTIFRHVSVARAPEPSDVWWENTLYGGWPIVKRRVISWILYFALLGVSLAVQVVLSRFAVHENEDQLNDTLSPNSRPGAAPTLNLDFDTFLSWKWTIVKTVTTMIFSAIGTGLIHVISDTSLFLRYTHNVGSTITKLALFQLCNQFVVLLLAFVIGGDPKTSNDGIVEEEGNFALWYTDGGLVELAFLVQVANAVAPSFAFLFRVEDVLNVHFFSRLACSKGAATQFLHPPAFRMNLRLGQAINTVGLSILYAPILPISPVIGLVGVIVQYAVDQYVALRHSSKPRSFQVEALTGANYVLRLLPLMQIILIWGLYFTDEDRAAVPAVIGIVIWGAAALLPLMNRVRQSQYTKWVEGGRPRLVDWAKPPGEKQATWTNHGALTSALNVLPDVPAGLRFNFDTYLPDVPSLDAEIFGQYIKPHFFYHNPPLPRTRYEPPAGTTAKISEGHYRKVEPRQEFTMALAAARPVQVPEVLSNTQNFQNLEIMEGPMQSFASYPSVPTQRSIRPGEGHDKEAACEHEPGTAAVVFVPPDVTEMPLANIPAQTESIEAPVYLPPPAMAGEGTAPPADAAARPGYMGANIVDTQ